MPHHKPHVRSSRRVPPLTDRDIDHEINLVDHDNSMSSRDTKPSDSPTNESTESTESTESSHNADQSASVSNQNLARSESQAPLTRHAGENGDLEAGPSRTEQIHEHSDHDEVDSPRPEGSSASQNNPPQQRSSETDINNRESESHSSRPKEPETEIDILYENQRGGFLCGIPLFSSAALGNLDPPAWTNFAHKPSPTDIHTAQVPDPSWQWAWPEWRVNHDDQIQADSDGWEYSFMFAKKFSWHSPKWYNSFVRRRAWIRRRIKVNSGYQAMDEQSMNPAYFTVSPKQREPSPVTIGSEAGRPSLDRHSRRSQGDTRRSRERSRTDVDDTSTPPDVKTTEDLMVMFRQSRIDREKLEAVENYINNCTDDLLHLQDHMHEIMSMFVFQTSRKTLLARLTQLHDEVASSKGKGKSATAPKAKNLAEAIKHADEEVRRLEYWSDIKGMAEDGEAVRAVDPQKGWDSGWQGLDNSGAKGVDEDEISR
ncbi:hypothetical protein F4680DRAFT_305603 [Xylaria scruposa]|nr:hypothetical protein F4680DRAFT_305603 [Xylaria scruposa]